jgi:hypothetical protein
VLQHAPDLEGGAGNLEVELDAAVLGLVLLTHLDEHGREAGDVAPEGERAAASPEPGGGYWSRVTSRSRATLMRGLAIASRAGTMVSASGPVLAMTVWPMNAVPFCVRSA